MEDLIVWKEAALLAQQVQNAARRVRGPGSASLADQMSRAATSVAANIAEGYGRGISRDGMRFFKIAHGSADELESHLRIAGMSGGLPEVLVTGLVNHTRRTGYLVHRYLSFLAKRLE